MNRDIPMNAAALQRGIPGASRAHTPGGPPIDEPPPFPKPPAPNEDPAKAPVI